MIAATSIPTGAKSDRPSFAAVAAAAGGASKSQQAPTPRKPSITTTNEEKKNSTTPSDGGAAEVNLARSINTTESAQPPQSFSSSFSADLGDAPLNMTQTASRLDRLDDLGTQVSSSSDSNKPQSLDGKSLTSGTTFALDEKESLRPDDSASVKAAAEDEDTFVSAVAPTAEAINNPTLARREFHDQYREINLIDQSRRVPIMPMFGQVPPTGMLYMPPQVPGPGIFPVVGPGLLATPGETTPDPKLREALENPRDRIWVLKLEQDIIDFVNDEKEVAFIVPQCHSFYRLLAHKIAEYYMLGHHVDDTTAAVRLFKTGAMLQLPPRLGGISTTPSTAASTPPPAAPQMKILRRGVDKHGPVIANGSGATSENGEDGDDKKSKALSREEREAKYEAARLRIMGSAKPVETSDGTPSKEPSRSSSTAGKKNQKKSRTDDDDDFEARSAYSNYYASPFDANALAAMQQTLPGYAPIPVQFQPSIYGQAMMTNPQQAAMPGYPYAQWPQQGFQAANAATYWQQNVGAPYDLSNDFQRAMSLQSPGATPGQTASQPYQSMPQNFSPQPQSPSWHGSQQENMPGYQQPGYGQGFPAAATFTPSHQPQVYAYGQLPSQSFPGRPQHKLEHPVPGSYKSKHFNPQSQAFIPGSPSTSMRPFTPQRQGSSQSHVSEYSSPAHTPYLHMQSSPFQQPMTHPLPQPVFPHQPSPLVPLPPKPSSNQHYNHNTHAGQNKGHGSVPMTPTTSTGGPQSITAKWGTPASLPAKPPPPSNAANGSTGAFSGHFNTRAAQSPNTGAQSGQGGNGGQSTQK